MDKRKANIMVTKDNLYTIQEDKNMQIVECKRNAKPGEIITFGTYPQNLDGADLAPIKWMVLQNTGSELFLLSEDILDCKRYHGKSANIRWQDCVDITWNDCDLRHWLNDEFYTTAFSAAEKELINTTLCRDNGEGTPDTEDKVFLLSVNEIMEASNKLGKNFLISVGTEFAKRKKADGCNLNGEEVGCSWWWLRTQGNKPSRGYFIGTGCSIRSYANVSVARDGVRPAIKINLGRYF